ncbi:MAG TPA: type II toxin-antitoxin system RelE/ParE family toxin [Micropepsaceae bacterium]|nr:type II toxin-antitoxin system RelE/ParE family toxin [Micropepsaceae bacterium]
MITKDLKPVEWVGSTYREFISFPEAVQQEMGYALYLAQTGRRHVSAKPMKGFGGAGVVELVEDDRHGTYRAVYTVKFDSAVYVLHAFQKKSRKGIKTPREEIDIVQRRLKLAEADHKARTKGST